ncbi:MAG: hypothetical protein E7592_02020 [Ruminococcaceae bacterium]|nr:hypothetical protein [Oscillospiraceae bacterium]
MKKIVVSLLLILSMLLALAACDIGGKKDDPEKNIDHLISSLNEGTNFEEIKTNTQPIDVEELLAKVKELEFEINATATMDGESEDLYAGMKDMVLYSKTGEYGADQYVFIEDDWTMVNVYGYEGEYSGYVDVSLKEMVDMLTSLEGEETTTPEEDTDTATAMVESILKAIMEAELPDATADDIEYKDGKYYLAEDYIKNVLDKCIDVVFDELGELGMPESELLDYKAAIKGYLDYINVKVYYYVELEEITGIGMSLTVDETFAAEKLEYSDIAISFEICIDKVAFDVLVANEDDVIVDASASLEFTTDKDDEIETLKLDVDAKVKSVEYNWDESTGSSVETSKLVTIKADLDFDFAAMEKGKGEFISLSLDYSDGVNGANVSVKADSSENGDKISCDATITAKGGSDTDSVAVKFDANMKSASNMPTVPQGAIDAKDAAIEEYNKGYDWWY